MQLIFLLSFFPYLLLGILLSRGLKSGSAWKDIAFSLAFTLVTLLILVGTLGRLLGSFERGLLIGSGLALILAVWLWSRQGWAQTGRDKSRPDKTFRRHLADLPLFALLLYSTILVAIIAVRYAIHDEVRLQGHISVVQAILSGDFPPHLIAFPGEALRYHYGFNLLAAVFSKVFSIPAYAGIDVVTILSWTLLVLFLLIFLEDLQVPRKGWALAVALILLTGGLSWWLARNDASAAPIFQLPNWQQMFVAHRHIHPSFILYFFQHPMGLGMVFFLGCLHFFHRWSQDRRPLPLLGSAAFLGCLSLVQVMLFATLTAVLGGYFFIRLFQAPREKGKIFEAVLLLGTAGGLAMALGGFFAQFPAGPPQLRLTWPPGYLRYEYYGSRRPIGWLQAAYWYLSGFGPLILLIPLAWWKAVRRKTPTLTVLAAFSALCFLVPQFFQYRYSWDIVKWFAAFEFSGKFLLAWAFIPFVLTRRWLHGAAWILLLMNMVTPLRFLNELAFRRQFTRPELRIAGYRPPELAPAWKEFVGYLQACRECRGTIWSSPSASTLLAMLTGFPTVQLDANTAAFLGDPRKIAARHQQLKQLEEAPGWALLHSLRIRWVIFNCQEVERFKPELRSFLDGLKKSPQVRNHSWDRGPASCYLALEVLK